MAKSIEINYNTGSGYEVLYPKVMMNNIGDWRNNVYSKGEVYNKNEIDIKISNIKSGDWEKMGTYNSTNNGDIVIGDWYNYWRKSFCFVLDKITGTGSKKVSQQCYIQVRIFNMTFELYSLASSTEESLKITDFTNLKKPFFFYYPLYSNGEESGTDYGQFYAVTGGFKKSRNNLNPETYSFNNSIGIDKNFYKFEIYYTGLDKAKSNLSTQVSVYSKNNPA